MDAEEAIANKYLLDLNLGGVSYEPDGNIPPDFLVNNHIAVEVRRLNQAVLEGESWQGLERTAISVKEEISKIAASFGAPDDGRGWYYCFRLFRRANNMRVLRTTIRDWFNEFNSSRDGPRNKFSNDSLEILFHEARTTTEAKFQFGIGTDYRATDFVLPSLAANIQRAIDEKTSKVAKAKIDYKIWWLVLVDRIGFPFSADVEVRLRPQLQLPRKFNRMIIIGLNGRVEFEMAQASGGTFDS